MPKSQKELDEIYEDLTEEDLKNENLHPKAQYIKCEYYQQRKIELMRLAFSEMYKCLDALLEPGRETSISYRKLEEAQMWAIKGITREIIGENKATAEAATIASEEVAKEASKNLNDILGNGFNVEDVASNIINNAMNNIMGNAAQ